VRSSFEHYCSERLGLAPRTVIRVRGRAPDRLVWEIAGSLWRDGSFGAIR
jgi:hypothetical protein